MLTDAPAAAAAGWALSETERAATVARIASTLSNMAFFKGSAEISDADAAAAALLLEKKAYTTALVAARTTTGDRPAAETTSGYARCVGLRVRVGGGCAWGGGARARLAWGLAQV